MPGTAPAGVRRSKKLFFRVRVFRLFDGGTDFFCTLRQSVQGSEFVKAAQRRDMIFGEMLGFLGYMEK